MKANWSVLLFLNLLLLVSICKGQDPTTAAKTFLSTLDDPLKVKTQFPYNSDERFNWHFVPMTRKGTTLNDYNKKQKEAALVLLEASLSFQGYNKAIAIFDNEKILRVIEKRTPSDMYRDPLNYHFSIFGSPSADSVWGWRIEGHHFSLNLTSINGEIVSSTPSFMGSNPGTVPYGEQKGRQILRQETDLGFLLINSLSPDQLKTALISETAFPEIITGDSRKAEPLDPKGLLLSAMTAQQHKIFLQLLDTYVRNYQFGFSNKLMAKIEKAGIDNLSFAWAGSLTRGAGYYYRIQGPMLIIELDNTQNNANHVHTAVRDLTNDFAEDILREHYAREHGK